MAESSESVEARRMDDVKIAVDHEPFHICQRYQPDGEAQLRLVIMGLRADPAPTLPHLTALTSLAT
ncbi:MAG: hypothetical protein HIU81_04475 [Acidobacteria bacterium]|nr:hypothetical protein [Acidobacteriota bacterium]